MESNKQLGVNLFANIFAFIVNGGIAFFLTPYITKVIGVEAYGFVSLGTNFINYASLITITLNSMAGRFITIEITKGNWEAANRYFNSVFFANIFIILVMLIPSLLMIFFLDSIVQIPLKLIYDVKMLFAFLFFNFFLTILFSTFSIATFANNKLYLDSLRRVESIIIRALLLVTLFYLFGPRLAFVGAVALFAQLYLSVFSFYYFKKMLFNLKITKKYFRIKEIYELVSAGIWNTIIKLGQLLLDGIDLLLINLFIGATAMGTLAIAKTVPALIVSIIVVIASAFVPEFTILYAKNDSKELVFSIKKSMRLLGVVTSLPVAILVAFGLPFFKLWVPSEDPNVLQVVSVITVFTVVVSGSINSLYDVFTVTNKLKLNAFVVVVSGAINVILVLILLRYTSLGIYAVAGISTFLSILRNLIFTIPFGAKYLGLKWYTFYPEVGKSIVAFFIVTILGLITVSIFKINNWFTLIGFVVSTCTLGVMTNAYIILNSSERNYIKTLMVKVIKKVF